MLDAAVEYTFSIVSDVDVPPLLRINCVIPLAWFAVSELPKVVMVTKTGEESKKLPAGPTNGYKPSGNGKNWSPEIETGAGGEEALANGE